MNRLQPLALLVTVVAAGCSSSDYSKPVAVASPPPASATDFSNFVVSQYAAASSTETSATAEVESVNFAFADDDNPTVFDSLLATAP